MEESPCKYVFAKRLIFGKIKRIIVHKKLKHFSPMYYTILLLDGKYGSLHFHVLVRGNIFLIVIIILNEEHLKLVFYFFTLIN